MSRSTLNIVRAYAECPYFAHYAKGAPMGICDFGCRDEPECVTNASGPADWDEEVALAARKVARASRGRHREVKHARDLMRHYAREALRWSR